MEETKTYFNFIEVEDWRINSQRKKYYGFSSAVLKELIKPCHCIDFLGCKKLLKIRNRKFEVENQSTKSNLENE